MRIPTALTIALRILLLLVGVRAAAATSTIIGATMDYNEEHQLMVDVLLSDYVPASSSAALFDISNYILLDVDSGRFLPITGVKLKQCGNNLQLLLDPTLYYPPAAKAKAHLHLFIKNIRLLKDEKAGTLDKDVSVRLEVNSEVEMVCTPPPPTTATRGTAGTVADQGSQHLLTAGKGKDDSDVYLSGQANGASGQKFTYTADVKLSFPFKAVHFSRVNTFAPLFTYNASTDPKANPDTLGIGLDWSLFPVRDLSPSPFTRLLLTNSPKIEGTHDLDSFNFVHGLRFTLLSRVARKGMASFYFLPYVGQEVGTLISSPIAAAEGGLIARPNAGGDLILVFDVNQTYLKSVSIESNGGRRWLLRNEVAVDTDKTGKVTAVNSTTKPKDDVKNTLSLNITDYWSITFSHEYGRVPPLYKLVDNKMTVGLTYKAVVNRKSVF
ncbi:MAG TPA: hypothetical protein VKW06_19220 [Candidatus Angelobacter sp.]|nr:hypothetical protein [Candidatus Angelobacter sp.]